MNYGEELAYWYLRMNGFFPITNFVFHRNPGHEYPSDCDVLGVRPQNTKERIRDNFVAYDDDLGLTDNLTAGIICEVKTGDVGTPFTRRNIRHAVDRLGLLGNEGSNKAKDKLLTDRICITDDVQIAKLLISDERVQRCEEGYFHLRLSHVNNFVRGRIAYHLDEKYAHRLHFKSLLLQTIIWDIRQRRRDE